MPLCLCIRCVCVKTIEKLLYISVSVLCPWCVRNVIVQMSIILSSLYLCAPQACQTAICITWPGLLQSIQIKYIKQHVVTDTQDVSTVPNSNA